MTLTQIVSDPLFLAGVVSVVGFYGARYRRRRSSVKHFLIRLLLFTLFTSLMLDGGVVPYDPGVMVGNRLQRLFTGSLEVVWWLAAAWLAVGFLGAFVVLSRQPRESKLVQDLLVSDGVLVARGEDHGREIEVARLAPGEYFGELALLTGEPLHARFIALTRVVIYEISKGALAPLLKAGPSMVEELSQSLASRRLAHRSLLDRHQHVEQHEERRSERLTATIRRLFALH
jgi:hypothetical protein